MPHNSTPSTLPFDRVLHTRRRTRAAKGFDDYDFLVRRAGQEITDRIEAVNHSFPLALDLGCHHGTLAQLNLPPTKLGMLVSADLSTGMLARASGLRVATDEEALPFRDASFELITSALSLHWVNDLPGALIQIRRALKPDGLFIGALLGGETLTELREVLTQAELEIEGGVSPHISPFAELRDVGGLLQRAGFALSVADIDRLTIRYANAFRLIADLRGMGETNVLSERRHTPMRRATFMRAAKIYAEKFGLPDGRVTATFEILYVTGWAPHESQQKPLPPGSAKARLADALHTEERKTGEKAPGG